MEGNDMNQPITNLGENPLMNTVTLPVTNDGTAYAGKPSKVLGIFPIMYQKYIKEVSRGKTVSEDLVIENILGAGSCCVMSKRAVKPKESWDEETARSWRLIAGDQDSGKSRTPDFIFASIIDTHMKYFDDYNKELEAKAKKKSTIPQRKPKLKQLLIRRSSLLGMAKAAYDNNSDVFIYSTEFGEALNELHKLKQDQKDVFLESYQTSFFQNNVSNSALCTKIRSGLLGATTVHKLLEVIKLEDLEGGFLTRTLVYLHDEEDNPSYDPNFNVSQESIDFHKRVMHNLISYERHDNGDNTFSPEIIPWEPEAKAVYNAWYQAKEEQKQRGDFPYPARFSRFAGSMTLRTIVVLHCLKSAAENKDGTEPITVETVEGAIKYMEDRNLMQIRVWDMVSEHLKSTQGSKYEAYRGKVVDALEVHADLIKQKNGRLTNDELFGVISPHIPSLSPVSLGKLLKGLGYASWRSATQRGFVIPVSTTTPTTGTNKKAA